MNLHLSSLDNPRVKQAIALRKPRDRRAAGLLIAEGQREITRAVQAGLVWRELFWCPAMLTRSTWLNDLVSQAARQPPPQPHPQPHPPRIYTVEPRVMHKLAYREHPQGAVAVFQQPRWDLERLMDQTSDPLWLVCSGIEKPGNLGAMVRSADAAGATGVLVTDPVVDPFNPNAIRASTGAVFSLPVLAVDRQQLDSLFQQRQVRVLAAVPESGKSYTQADWRGPAAILIGSEQAGIDPAWLSDRAVCPVEPITIPMHGRMVDSLNASVAAAILLFEAARQREQDS